MNKWRIVSWIGLLLLLSSVYFVREETLFYLVLLIGIALATAGLWLPPAWRWLERHIWWLSAIVGFVATVAMFATGHLWAFAALLAIEVVTLMFLVVWSLLRGMAEAQAAMEDEKPECDPY